MKNYKIFSALNVSLFVFILIVLFLGTMFHSVIRPESFVEGALTYEEVQKKHEEIRNAGSAEVINLRKKYDADRKPYEDCYYKYTDLESAYKRAHDKSSQNTRDEIAKYPLPKKTKKK